MGADTLYNRGKLDVVAVNFLEEMIEVCVEVIHYGQGIPFYPVFFQQVDALHYLGERRTSLTVLAVFIVELLWPVDGHAYQPGVLFEEFAPLIRQQGTVCINLPFPGSSNSRKLSCRLPLRVLSLRIADGQKVQWFDSWYWV